MTVILFGGFCLEEAWAYVANLLDTFSHYAGELLSLSGRTIEELYSIGSDSEEFYYSSDVLDLFLRDDVALLIFARSFVSADNEHAVSALSQCPHY